MRINRPPMDRMWTGSMWRQKIRCRTMFTMFRIALLDAIGRPIRRIDQQSSLRAVIEEALRLDCRWIALEQQRAGSPLPLPRDILMTRRIRRQLQPIDIRIADHVIAGDTQSFSFRAHGLL